MRYGSLSVETSYQPSGLPCSAAMRPASVIRPSTRLTCAPYSSHSRMNGTFTSFGMNTCAGMPARAAYAAIALAAFPADGTDSVLRAEMRGAGHRGGQAARLERVGRVERLVLHEQASRPSSLAEAPGVHQRRPAFAERQRLLAVEERHQLAIPPHVGLAAGQRVPWTTRAPASRSYRASRGAPHVHRCCSTRGS